MIEPENSPETDESHFENISQRNVQNVQAEAVRIHQASAGSIAAEDVTMHQSAAAAVKATRVSTHQSALAAVESVEVLADQTFVGMLQAEGVSLSGYAGVVTAGNADIRNAMAAVVVGTDLRVSDSRTVLLIGRNVQGNVTTLMDTRSALISGLVAGLFSGIMLLLGRALFRRK
ncbi:MAG TPA: hypothetical protein VK909_10730 [Anaerolineales bacterium]|nr:hypothetical protein [Anaerolineales bacterium]